MYVHNTYQGRPGYDSIELLLGSLCYLGNSENMDRYTYFHPSFGLKHTSTVVPEPREQSAFGSPRRECIEQEAIVTSQTAVGQ